MFIQIDHSCENGREEQLTRVVKKVRVVKTRVAKMITVVKNECSDCESSANGESSDNENSEIETSEHCGGVD